MSERARVTGAAVALTLAAAACTGNINHAATGNPDAAVDAMSTTATATTAPYVVTLCGGATADCNPNSIDLSVAGAPAGTTITFYAQGLAGAGLYLTDVTLTAAAGAYVVHPLFVSDPAATATNPDPDPIIDLDDTFSAVALDLPAASAPTILGPELALGDFAPTDPITITFTAVGPYDPSKAPSTMPTGGCLALPTFEMAAQAALATNCASCHTAAGQSGFASMDIAGIAATNDAEILMACDAVLGEVVLTAPATSAIFIEPDPTQSDPTHGFHFPATGTAYADFMTAITPWIQAEAAAAPKS